jgi:hypothetical protein
MQALHNRFRNTTLKIFERYGMKVIGFWETEIGPSNNDLVYILAFEDLNQRQAAWEAFIKDPDWIKAREESERDGVLVQNVENRILEPTDYSPLK